jgi:subtilisin family serine protease
MKHRKLFIILFVLFALGGMSIPFLTHSSISTPQSTPPFIEKGIDSSIKPRSKAQSSNTGSRQHTEAQSGLRQSTQVAPQIANADTTASSIPAASPETAPTLAVRIDSSAPPEDLSPVVLAQIADLQAEKALRTPAQRKINSDLLLESTRKAGTQKENVQNIETHVDKDEAGRVLVDVKAAITPDFTAAVAKEGGEVVNSFPEYESMRAWLPLSAVETLASRDDVKFIRPAVPLRTHAGKVTSQGDSAHKADLARTAFNISGAGVKVGVLSDSVDYLSQSQSAGELGAVTVLPGQGGSGTGEGTAMLEIIHDLAPNASLYFATADGSPAAFANNIKGLRKAGCDIIVDDVGYLDEAPFQDGIIAQAVNTVTTNGALYFSSAGNSGNKRANHSGTWEGDFVEGGAYSAGGSYHSFGSLKYNTVKASGSQSYAALFWSDPLGKSTNDYDLYVLNSTGTTIVAKSDDYQNGTIDPVEFVDQVRTGQRLVIVRSSGEPRFLHLDTGDAELSISTGGNVRGHPCAEDAFCVAAMSIQSAQGGPFLGGLLNPLEYFSSDGPRRIFYASDGTPVTPGNFTSTGGVLRQKPDVTAADGVTTSVPGFAPFYGTSAAAPHAAAVAALVKSYNTNLTTKEIRKALVSSAIDVNPAGLDEDSGAGIVNALGALQAIVSPGAGSGGTASNAGKIAISSSAGMLTLKLNSAVGESYEVEVSDDLSNWTPAGALTNTTGALNLREPMNNARAFYRFRKVVGTGS